MRKYGIIPGHVFDRLAQMSGAAVRLLVALSKYMAPSENKPQGECWPKAKTIMLEAGISDFRTLKNARNELVDLGLKWKATRNKNTHWWWEFSTDHQDKIIHLSTGDNKESLQVIQSDNKSNNPESLQVIGSHKKGDNQESLQVIEKNDLTNNQESLQKITSNDSALQYEHILNNNIIKLNKAKKGNIIISKITGAGEKLKVTPSLARPVSKFPEKKDSRGWDTPETITDQIKNYCRTHRVGSQIGPTGKGN